MSVTFPWTVVGKAMPFCDSCYVEWREKRYRNLCRACMEDVHRFADEQKLSPLYAGHAKYDDTTEARREDRRRRALGPELDSLSMGFKTMDKPQLDIKLTEETSDMNETKAVGSVKPSPSLLDPVMAGATAQALMEAVRKAATRNGNTQIDDWSLTVLSLGAAFALTKLGGQVGDRAVHIGEVALQGILTLQGANLVQHLLAFVAEIDGGAGNRGGPIEPAPISPL